MHKSDFQQNKILGKPFGNPLQYSCLETPRDGGAWWVAIYGVAQSWTQLKRLSLVLLPGKEEPGRLQSMGLLRVGHD